MSIIPTQNSDFIPPLARAFAPYLILALIVYSAYGNIFLNEFLFDDDLIIKLNAYLRDWDHIEDILTGSTTSGVHIVGGFYRPLQILLYLFAYQLGNGDTFWFHALNLALHIGNTCFVYKLGTKLGFDPKGVFLAALIWGVHPIHTEAITYMSGTADPLFVFFCLWAMVVLLPDFTRRKILMALPLMLLGIVSKETMVMFPLLVMVTLFYVSPKRFHARTYFNTWPLWAISLAYAYWRTHAAGFDGPQSYQRFYEMPSFADLKIYAEEPLYRIYTFLATLPEYLRLLAWPTNLHMERSFPIHTLLNTWPVVAGIVMIVFASGHIAYSFKIERWKGLAWGFLWFGAAHAPDTGLLVPMNSLFLEHWMYLPSVGLFLGIGQTLVSLTKGLPRAIPLAGSFAALAFATMLSVKTYNQNEIWRNPHLFYNNIFANGETSARCHNNLALYYSNLGRFEEAIKHFNRAIEISDIYAETHFNLAIVYLNTPSETDKIAKAIANLERSLEIQPNFFRSYKALGDIYNQLLHDGEKAHFYYSRADAAFNEQK